MNIELLPKLSFPGISIQRTSENKWWLSKEGGEGMELTDDHFEELLENFYRENF